MRVEFTGRMTAGAISIGGQTLMPDKHKAYMEFFLAHSWPVVTVYGTCLHPATVRNSYQSMLHQVLDLEHLMRGFDKENIARDRILGTIVGVEHSWNGVMPKTKEEAPNMRAVAVIHKMAEGVDRLLGSHQSGRHEWSVSMELNSDLRDAAFVVELPQDAKEAEAELAGEFAGTPGEFARLGYGCASWARCSDELFQCWAHKELGGSIVKKYRERSVALMLGGVDGLVTFQGVGVVKAGAEKEAYIAQVLASRGMLKGDGEAERCSALREKEAVAALVLGKIGAGVAGLAKRL